MGYGGAIGFDGPGIISIERTTLVNLAIASEASQNHILDPTFRPTINGSNVLTALPIWFFNAPRGQRNYLYLEQVTVVLPVSDFASLFALATVGGPQGLALARRMYPEWKEVQGPQSILDQIGVFDVAR